MLPCGIRSTNSRKKRLPPKQTNQLTEWDNTLDTHTTKITEKHIENNHPPTAPTLSKLTDDPLKSTSKSRGDTPKEVNRRSRYESRAEEKVCKDCEDCECDDESALARARRERLGYGSSKSPTITSRSDNSNPNPLLSRERGEGTRPPSIARVRPEEPDVNPPKIVVPSTSHKFKSDFMSILEDTADEIKPLSSLWVDKYAPKKISSVVGNSKTVAEFEKWAKEIGPNCKKKACMISGPPGIGKTTMAKIILQSIGFDVMEFNASSDRSKTFISNKIKELSKSKTYYLQKIEDDLQKAIIMDEVDGMSTGDDGGITELTQFIRQLNKSDSKTAIICICNERSKTLNVLGKECLDLKFYKPNRDVMFQKANYILSKEKHRINSVNLYKIVDVCDGDLRKLINTLQFMCVKNETLFHNNIINNSVSDKKYTIFDAYTNLTDKCSTIFSKEESALIDSHMESMLIHENYIKDDDLSVDSLVYVSDSLSLGDVYMKEPYYSWNSVVAPAINISRVSKPNNVKFPSLLGKSSVISKNKNTMKYIHQKSMHLVNTNNVNELKILLIYISKSNKSIVQDYAQTLHNMQLNTDDIDFIDSLGKYTNLKKKTNNMKLKIALEKLSV